MPKIALVTDNSNDLPPELLARHHIRVVPLLIHFGDEEHRDEYEQREVFWQRLAEGQVPRSAAPSPEAFAAVFRQALQEAEQVIAITITGKHSSTYNSAMLAASEFDNQVFVFDSWTISLGVGLQVLRAAEDIERGLSAPDILDDLSDVRSRLRIMFYLDSLDAVQRGGRIALAMSAIKRMSSMLSIKIILNMHEGELAYAGAVRSPRKAMAHMLQAISGKRAERVAVVHTRSPKLIEQFADQVAATLDFPREDILLVEAGPLLGVQGGAGAFGVIFFEKL